MSEEQEENYSEVVRGKVPPFLKKKIVEYGQRKLMLEAEIVRQAVREYIERAEARERAEQEAEARAFPGPATQRVDEPNSECRQTPKKEGDGGASSGKASRGTAPKKSK